MYNKRAWYEQYVLGQKMTPNENMQGGIDVGERIVSDPSFLPSIPRPEIFEQEFFATLDGITLTGHLDGWSSHVPGIDEYKTTLRDTRWTQQSVDAWGQITFYCLLVWLNLKIPPEKLQLQLFSIPMIQDIHFKVIQYGDPKKFQTKRTMKDILLFSKLLKDTCKAMEEYIKLSTITA